MKFSWGVCMPRPIIVVSINKSVQWAANRTAWWTEYNIYVEAVWIVYIIYVREQQAHGEAVQWATSVNSIQFVCRKAPDMW